MAPGDLFKFRPVKSSPLGEQAIAITTTAMLIDRRALTDEALIDVSVVTRYRTTPSVGELPS
jgi:hypothetical protein